MSKLQWHSQKVTLRAYLLLWLQVLLFLIVGLNTELKSEGLTGVWFLESFSHFMTLPQTINFYLVCISPLVPIFMVSNFAYRSHESLHLRSIKPFKLLSILVLIVGLIAFNPFLLGWLFFLFYALSGPFEWILGWKKARDEEEIFHINDDGPEL
jgi:hypothetical protein